MHITLQPVEDKASWERFISITPEANFLQSWNWGVFQQQLGKRVLRMAVLLDGSQVGAVQLIKEEAKRGTYLAVAGGPLIDWNNREVVMAVMTQLIELGKVEKAQFIRFRPQAVSSAELESTVASLGATPAPMHLTADLTLQLDLTQSTDEILAGMRKNTRYEVRRAEKLGITVSTSQDEADIAQLHQDQLYLAEKHGFVPFSYEFWHEQFLAFAADNQVLLFHSYLGEQRLASAFIIFYNKEAVYHYGTSTDANGKLPGSYACQWAAIQEAQRRGCTRYNFWGIAPQDAADHRFAGVSTFKRGFGGVEVPYLPAHDLALSASYQLIRGFEFMRKKMRKL